MWWADVPFSWATRMGIRVACEKCGYKYHLKDELAGKKVKCKICRATFAVPAGGPVYVHAPRTKDFELAIGDNENIEQIANHVECHFGKIATVFHEIISDLVHVDVHWVQPTGERPYHTLVTSGMSDRPMTVPEGAENLRYAELMLCLPAEWQISQEAFKDERYYWPVRLLKMLARFPHEYDTWLCFGHTIPNDDPPQPYAANTKLCCALLLAPLLADQEFWSLKVNEEKTIRFYSLVPLYREEMEFKLKQGADPLLDKFGEHEVTELLDIKRKNVCKRGWW
jgi:ribosomal protein S27E